MLLVQNRAGPNREHTGRETETPPPADGSSGPYVGVKLGAVVLVVVGAVHGSVSHGDDPRPDRSVLGPVGLLSHGRHTFNSESEPVYGSFYGSDGFLNMQTLAALTSRSCRSHSYCLKRRSSPNSR